MSYLVLARKWRPQIFDDLEGQEHVSRTISNAITSGRVAHAFLFTGARGVGKTTSARILAKALNCEHGPTPKPCLTCGPCVDIANCSDMDVQEIDGASYNGVDEVRRLQESLPYRPSRDRFKIVIVDEVHMLSSNAWNAFLKTLEEPPPHVKFIFATTEAHKVPITILSRCQRYDFKMISALAIIRRLRFVLEQEKIEADDAALSIIAREAAGSMRDAMSLLDQAIAWGGEKLVGEEISRVLGVAGRSTLHQLVTSLVRGDGAGCLGIVGQIADQGFDIVNVTRDTLEHLRDLVVAKICKEPGPLLDLTDEEAGLVRDLVSEVQVDDLLRLHLGFSKGFDQVVSSPNQRTALEMLLVRLAFRPPLRPIDDLLSRLGQLERRLAGGAGASGASRSAPRASLGSANSEGSFGATATARKERPIAEASGLSLVAQLPEQKIVAEKLEPQVFPEVVDEPRPNLQRAKDELSEARVSPIVQEAPVSFSKKIESAAVSSSPPEVKEASNAAAPVQRAALAIDQDLFAEWRRILDAIRAQDMGLAAILEHAVPLKIGAEHVELGFEQDSFFAAQARGGDALDVLTRVVRNYFGRPTNVSISLDSPALSTTVASIDEAAYRERVAKVRRDLETHPLVEAATKHLGAKIVSVKVASEG